MTDTGEIREIPPSIIFDHNPTAPASDTDEPLNRILPWIKHNAKVTIILQRHFTTPKQSYLHHIPQSDEWTFIPGRHKSKEPIPLPNFKIHTQSMVDNKRLFKGWINNTKALTARRAMATSNIISHLVTARLVSATDLHHPTSPTSLLKHAQLHPSDRRIWDASYREEYDGLVNLDTWEVINEQTYQLLKAKAGKIIPTMAISTIKKDKFGNPHRAKYRIVVLGNLDPHSWDKSECFAPVLSQFEFRLLISLATRLGCIPKGGDVSQAFYQSTLPIEELYICTPPHGCPITPPNSYWRLLKTLYGLRRSPRHWYNKACSILKSIGLQQCPNAPCIFHGTILPGQPPLYVGIYVDDFIYFSQSPTVENHFEHEFAQHVTKVTFNPVLDFFLGIKLDITKSNNAITIQLSQQAFIEQLAHQENLDEALINCPSTPYRQGYPIDSIPTDPPPPTAHQHKLTKNFQSIVGSLNWLSISTRPDIATATNLLAKHSANPSSGHLTAARRVIKYLIGTKNRALAFTTHSDASLNAFIKFPISPTHLLALTDANWGPQDQSLPNPKHKTPALDLFKSRSLSGFILFYCGLIHWSSKRKSLTARSSAEAETVATDECTKHLLYMRNIVQNMNLLQLFMPSPVPVYNDNAACVQWSKNMTTKGLRYIQIRENAIRESVQSQIITIKHTDGKTNLADLFTKEDKDVKHFHTLRDLLVTPLIIVQRGESGQRGVLNPNPTGLGDDPPLPSSSNTHSHNIT